MRRLVPFLILPLAACATAPRQAPPPTPGPVPAPTLRTSLSGLDQTELVAKFGPAPFQVREGPGLKLQWQNATCVLDAYLYPANGSSGELEVTHVDTRRTGSGESVPVPDCITSLSVR